MRLRRSVTHPRAVSGSPGLAGERYRIDISAVTAHESKLEGAQAITSSSSVASSPPCTFSSQPSKFVPGSQVVLAVPSPSSIARCMPIGFVPPQAKQL